MDIQTKTVAAPVYEKLIRQGITDAKGSAGAIELATEDDFKNFGRMLADREARVADLFSAVVSPVNNLAAGIGKGGFTGVYNRVNKGHSRMPLREAAGAKRIYFVPVTEHVYNGGEEAYVNKFGLTLCKRAPNYLLGAMMALPEHKLPGHLKDKDMVAVEKKAAPVFTDEDGLPCFLYVHRHAGGRMLSLVQQAGDWDAAFGWVLLAEKP